MPTPIWKTVFTHRGMRVGESPAHTPIHQPLTFRVPLYIDTPATQLRLHAGGWNFGPSTLAKLTLAPADPQNPAAPSQLPIPITHQTKLNISAHPDHPTPLDPLTLPPTFPTPGPFLLQITFADPTAHLYNAVTPAWCQPGDHHHTRAPLTAQLQAWPCPITRVDALTTNPTPALACVGDSITFGHGLSPAEIAAGHAPYPAQLARLLHRTVLNLGGNGTFLTELSYDSLLAPLQNISAVILLAGINDIVHNKIRSLQDYLTAAHNLLAPARRAGLRTYLGTILPARGEDNYEKDPAREPLRQSINHFLLSSAANILADAVINFDAATADPQLPDHLLPAYHCGDLVHPNAQGYIRMAQAAHTILKKDFP